MMMKSTIQLRITPYVKMVLISQSCLSCLLLTGMPRLNPVFYSYFVRVANLMPFSRYYTDESCNNMISYTGYANDFCITTSPSTSYMVDYPSLTLYNASHDCSVYTKRGYAIFGPFSCASNPYTSNSEYLFNSQYYSSGLMQKGKSDCSFVC